MQKFTVILILLVLCSNMANAEVLEVPEIFSSIQEAVDNASENDTILIFPGHYYENITVFNIPLTFASLLILGDEYSYAPEQTFIDGQGLEFNQRPLISFNDCNIDTSRIIGLSFINSYNYCEGIYTYGGGIGAFNANMHIKDCYFENCISFYGGAVFGDSCKINLEDNSFFNNCARDGGAVFYANFSKANIKNNSFEFNSALGYGGGAIRCCEYSMGVISRNVFSNSMTSHIGGALSLSCRNMLVHDNYFYRSTARSTGGAIYAAFCDSIEIERNIFLQNTIIDTSIPTIRLGKGACIKVNDIYEYSSIQNNSFLKNDSYSHGGVGYLAADSLEFSNNVLIGNRGSYSGAITFNDINAVNPTIFFHNNLIKFNRCYSDFVDSYEAAVYAGPGATGILFENTFYSNFVRGAGENSWEESQLYSENDYWGHETGPYHATQNPDGQGDTVSTLVDVLPFSTEPFWEYGLEFDTEVYDFGYVQPGQSVTHNISLTNTTDEELEIFRLVLIMEDSVFTAPSMDSLLIMPFESISVPITFTPTDTVNYYDILSTVAFNPLASGTTIEFLGTGIDEDAVDENQFIPTQFTLSQPHPNPFNPSTKISMFLPEPGDVKIAVYDLNGRLVKDVFTGFCPRGQLPITVDLKDSSSGIYFLRVHVNGESFIRKMMLIK